MKDHEKWAVITLIILKSTLNIYFIKINNFFSENAKKIMLSAFFKNKNLFWDGFFIFKLVLGNSNKLKKVNLSR